jgi:hypothetical protein
MVIGLHVCASQNITKQKNIEKIMQCPFIKSPSFLYGSVFFLKRIDYYAFIAEQLNKNHFLNEISYENLKFLNGSRFN